MAQCPTCGSSVPDQVDVCPDCGMDLRVNRINATLPDASPAPVPFGVSLPDEAATGMTGTESTGSPANSSDDFFTTDKAATGADAAAIFDIPFNTAPGPASDAGSPIFDNTIFDNTVPAHFADTPPSIPALSLPGATATLALKRGGTLTGDRFAIGPFATIGRFDPDSGPVDVDMGPLPEAVYVSRHHAELRYNADGTWLIKDLGSRNGTFVRSGGSGQFQRVQNEQIVRHGDEISLGNARFEFQTTA